MIIYFDSIKEGNVESINYSGNIYNFNKFNQSSIISKFNSIDGEICLSKTNNILIVKFNLKCNIDAISSYSLNVFKTDIKIEDELYLTNLKEFENDEIIYCSQSINLDEIIYSLAVTAVPIDIHQEGEELPSGEDFKVYSEDELENELNNEDKESPFDILDKFDL